VADIWPGPEYSIPGQFLGAGGTLFFVANDGTHGREPWISDGSAAGTRIIDDVRPGPRNSHAGEFTEFLG
jgi:ELWxxDGT repeat protein